MIPNASSFGKILRQVCFLLALLMSLQKSFAQDAPTQVSANQNAFSIGSNDLRALQNSVNMLTGSVAFPMGLMDVGLVGGMSFPIAINYSSEVTRQVETWNKESPTGMLGLGWNFSTPRIIVDNKSTGNREDDDFFISGNGVNSRLVKIRNTTRSSNPAWEFLTTDHTNWKIYYLHGLERWEVVIDDGSVMTYGGRIQNPTAVQWVVKWDNWIGNSSLTTGQSRQALVWDLAEIKTQWNDWVKLSYLKIENRVSTDPSLGQYHTEASYLQKVENSFGGTVGLFYSDKFSYEYYEPHTEVSEPDAFQERYESKFLERLEYRNHNDKLLQKVHLGYDIIDYKTTGHTTEYMKKRLLTSIERENEWGERNGKVTLKYKNNVASHGALKGMLDRVSLENGARIDFNYKSEGQSITGSDLNKVINAPAGYAHPKVWHGSNYSIVAWRKASSDHVKVFAYSWNGKWNEQELFDIDDVQTEDTEGFVNPNQYKDFQVVLGSSFFAILNKKGDDWHLYYANIDQHKGDQWKTLGDQKISSTNQRLLNGEDFFAVLGVNNGRIKIYDFRNNDFYVRNINLPNGTYYGAAANNYIFVLDEDGNDISMLYKNSLGDWVTRNALSSIEPSTQQPSRFYSANGFVVGILHDNEESVFNWNSSYTVDKRTNLGNFDGRFHLVENFSNDLFSIKSTGGFGTQKFILGRFDGSNWVLKSQNSLLSEHSLGENLATIGYFSSPQYIHQRLEYNPNNSSWSSEVTLPIYNGAPNASLPTPYPHASFPNVLFKWPYFLNRNANGSWSRSSTTSATSDINNQAFSFMKGPNYIYHRGSTNKVVFYQIINGKPTQQSIDVGRFSGDERYYQPGLFSFNSFNNSNPRFATSIELHRIDGTQVEGRRRDYPISYTTYFDGYQSYYTSYSFENSTGKFDPSGNTVQYGKADVFAGTNNQANTYGKTTIKFYNGLPETGNTSHDNSSLYYGRFNGSTKSVEQFKNSGVLVSSTVNTYFYEEVFTNPPTSHVTHKHGYLVPKTTTTILDGVRNSIVREYYRATGQLSITRESTLSLSGKHDRRTTMMAYGWLKYPGMDSKNILNVPISQKVLYNNKVISHQVTKMKEQSGKWRTDKTFIWDGTGSDSFDTYWTGEDPSTGWRRTAEIVSLNSKGLPKQTNDIDSYPSATYYHYKGYNPLLTVSNATASDIYADDFNRNNTGHFGGLWNELSGNWSLLNGNVGIRSAGNGYLLLDKNFKTSLLNQFIAEFRYRTFSGSALSYLAFEFNKYGDEPSDDDCADCEDPGDDVPPTGVSSSGLQVRFFKNGSVGLYEGNTRLGNAGSIAGISGEWHDVRAVRTGDVFRLYVDGNEILHVDISIWSGLGRHFGMENKNIASEIDDFRVYPSTGRAVYTSYENQYQYPEKSIDAAGFTVRSLRDVHGSSVAEIDEQGQVVSTTMGSTSKFRRGSFSTIDPDLILSTVVLGEKSYYQAFDEEPRTHWNWIAGSADSQTGIQNGRFIWATQGGNTGQSDQYQLTLPESLAGKVGIEFDVFLDGNATGNTFGFAVGSTTASLANNNQVATKAVFDGNEVLKSGSTTITSQLNPERLHRIKVVLEGQKADYYMDGKLVKSSVSFLDQVSSIGRVIFFNEGKGGQTTWYLDNLVVYQEPSHAISYLDAGGKLRQSISEALDDQTMISESFYDALGRGYASTKEAKVNSASLAFNQGFVTSFNGTTIAGTVASIFDSKAFYRTSFEKSPLGRVLEQGLPATGYQLGGHTTKQYYQGNQTDNTSPYYMGEDELANVFFANRAVDADGGESISFTDTWGRTLVTKSGKRDIVKADGSIVHDYVTTQYEYDDYGRLSKVYHPNYFYPSTGIADDFVSETTYDHFGQPITVTTPDGGVSRTLYDTSGKLRFSQDENGIDNHYVFYWKYDELDRVMEEGYWNRSWTGLAATTTVPSSAIWKKKYEYYDFTDKAYLRDALYRVKVNNDEDGNAEAMEEYGYDHRLRVVETKKWTYAFSSSPEIVRMGYNEAGQVISEDYGHGTPAIHYTYYKNGTLKSIGTASDADQFAFYEYGDNGAITGEYLNNRAFSRNYTFDELDRLTTIDDPYFRETLSHETGADGSTQYHAGKIGRTAFTFKASQWGSAPRPTNYHYAYSYNDEGMLLSANHSTDATHDIGVGSAITFDANGNLKRLKRGSETKNYEYYDGTNKIKNTQGNEANRYLYDGIGNVTGKDVSAIEVINGTRTISAYGSKSYKLEGDYKVTFTSGFHFDANTQVKFEATRDATGGGMQLTYDKFMDRTQSVTEEDYSVNFEYGADDYRVYKESNTGNATRKTLYIRGQGLSPGLVRMIEPDGTAHQVFFIYGPSGAIATIIDGITYYHLKDHVGSTRVIVSETGNVSAYYNYRPFGGLINSYVGIANNYLFQGQEKDPETGLYNFHARLYDEDLGRFLSVDPAGQYASPYLALGNNPASFVDPDGELAFLAVLAIGAVVGGAINLGIKAYQGQINSFGDGLAAFGIGAVAGAAGAATGGAAFAAAGGAAGGVGGFLAGFAGGAVSSAVATPIQSLGNTLYFGDPFLTPKQFFTSVALGGLIGGGINGGIAAYNGRKFFTGNIPVGRTPIPTTALTPKGLPEGSTELPRVEMAKVNGGSSKLGGPAKPTPGNVNDPLGANGTRIRGDFAGKNITFGDDITVQFGKGQNQIHHAFRHTDALGLDRALVQSSVQEHLKTVANQVISGKPFNQIIHVAGQKIQYTAFRLPNGTFNIGRIHGVK